MTKATPKSETPVTKTSEVSEVSQARDTSGDSEDLAKLKEILFGEQFASLQAELARVEDSLTEMTNRMNTAVGDRIAGLEVDMRQQFNALAERLDRDIASLGNQKLDKRNITQAFSKALGEIDADTADNNKK